MIRPALLATGGLAVALTALAVAGGPSPAVLRAAPAVRVLHVTEPTPANSTITLHNDSAAPITVASLVRDPSCDPEVTASLATPLTIPNGSSAPVGVACAGSVATGMKRCLLRALSNTGTLVAELETVCEGGNATTLTAAPMALDFGSVAVGDTASLVVTLTSTQPGTIARLSLQTTTLDNTFVLGGPCNPDARECDATIIGIASGGSTQVSVACAPTTMGTRTADLRIATDTGAYVGAPITLTCTGTAPAGPVLAITGDPVDAGDVETMGMTASPRPLRLRNAGTGNVVLSGIQIVDTGDGAANEWSFVLGGTCTGNGAACVLGQDDTADIALTFDPTVIGLRVAVLVVGFTEGGTARSRTIPLLGTGLGDVLVPVGPTSLDFGSVLLNTTSTLELPLANLGNRAATVDISPVTPPFTPHPPSPLSVAPGAPTPIPFACRPSGGGTFDANFLVTAPSLLAPLDVPATCNATPGPLFTSPSALHLGELHRDTATTFTVTAQTTGAPLIISSAVIDPPSASITAEATLPSAASTPITVTIASPADEEIDHDLVIGATSGAAVRVPLRGRVRTAAFREPAPRALGTFCVARPTTPDSIALTSTGTASILLAPPQMMMGALSPFDIVPLSPSRYPAVLAPSAAASLFVLPKRSLVAGVKQDAIVWTSDVEGRETTTTPVSAEFVDDGGAVAPSALTFGPTVIHITSENAQRVTLQNCDTQPIVFDTVQVPSPFRIDIGRIPEVLQPNETVTFSIGFHPTSRGAVSTQMEITAPQLTAPLVIRLDGEGIVDTLPPDAGTPAPGFDDESFYGCDGCSSRAPAGGLAPLAALLFTLSRRRRGSS